ncbi:MAG: hypothetical protein AUG13_05870 [Chloroflexi bacterium 13_1_20CM_2_59_7]|nr:MAG: hypothetical protein AUG13_05870 [Chloroflexi bacterium 13_1_20CM_2_59_7]
MKRNTRHPIWSWIIHTPWVLAVLGILSVLAFFGSGAGNPLLTRLITHRLEVMTGGKVELRSLSIQWLAMRGTLKGLVGAADRFGLGAQSFGERTSGSETTRARARR